MPSPSKSPGADLSLKSTFPPSLRSISVSGRSLGSFIVPFTSEYGILGVASVESSKPSLSVSLPESGLIPASIVSLAPSLSEFVSK